MNKLLINEEPLLIIPSLARTIGLNESIILQQIHYWLQKSQHTFEGVSWIYNTYEGWQKQFPFWSISTIRRAITSLERQGFIVTSNFNKMKIDNTKWYRLQYELVEELSTHDCSESDSTLSVQNEQSNNQVEQFICSIRTDDSSKLNKPLPEITSESTSDTFNYKKDKASEPQECPFHFYEQNGFGTIGSHMHQKISLVRRDMSDEMIIEAMKFAVEKGIKNWRYVEAIIRDWMKKGYKSVEDITTGQVAYKKKQRSIQSSYQTSNNGRKNIRREIVPEWLANPQEQTKPSPIDIQFETEKKQLQARLDTYKVEKKQPISV